MNKFLIVSSAIVLLVFQPRYSIAQVTTEPFAVHDSHGMMNGIDQIVIKADHKMYAFKMDTTSVDYKLFSQIDPHWIKAIDILKNKPLEGEAGTVIVITLKRRKIKQLPEELRKKFYRTGNQ